MTIRNRLKATSSEEAELLTPITTEPGFFVECDSCFTHLTHAVRIRCADPICESSSIDICAECFRTGKEFGKHKRNHAYRIIEKHWFPVIEEEWSADEELMLLDGLLMHGMGNWAAVAEYMGSRTKAEVEEHYRKYYISSQQWPLPETPAYVNATPDEMHQRKRRRIEYLTLNPPLPQAPVQNSGPTSHEISGYMPGRLEFEHEVDNEAEDMIKDMEFGIVRAYGGDEQIQDPADAQRFSEACKAREDVLINGASSSVLLRSTPTDVKEEEGKDELPPPTDALETSLTIEMKLSLLSAYNARLDKRYEAKTLIFDRGLLEYRKLQAADKRRTKEDRDFQIKIRPLAKVQTAVDNEDFVNGLGYEHVLRRRIAELQDTRKRGMTSLSELDIYERMKNQRFAEAEALRNQQRNGDIKRDEKSRKGKITTLPLTLGTSPGLTLLTADEQSICSQSRMLPRAYLAIKGTLIREYQRCGGELSRKQALNLLKCDVVKTGRVYDYLVKSGLFRQVPSSAILPTPISFTNGLTNGHHLTNGHSTLTNGTTSFAQAPILAPR